MNPDLLARAVALAQQTGHVLLATVSADGIPHLAAAGPLALDAAGRVLVTEWFCPQTVANLRGPRHPIAIVAWDAARDAGYQLLGVVQGETEVAFLDGYAPRVEAQHPVPQVREQLAVQVERVLDFRLAPHTDREE